MTGNVPSGAAAPALDARNLTVRHGSFTALEDVSARFDSGHIHAVVGQNGTGKTTFARVVAGLVAPAEGQVIARGQPMPPGDVLQARKAGIELVHQSFALPPTFSVAEALQSVRTRRGHYCRQSLERLWQDWLDGIGIELPAGARIRDLRVESQQSAEIDRAMVSDARPLIPDEPTAVLAPEGIDRLFGRVRGPTAQITVILRTFGFILAALVLCALIFAAVGLSTSDTLAGVIDGALFRPRALEELLR